MTDLRECQRLPHRRQHLVVRRKTLRILLCDPLLANPHGEFAPAAFDDFRFGPDLLLDVRRHTGGARLIISDPTESNADALHKIGCS